MNTKYLVSTSIFTLFTASMTQAADIRIPRESRPVVAPVEASSVVSPVIAAPIFSWDGFYLGGQIGGFSSKSDRSLYAKQGSSREWAPVGKDALPQLSGFMGGLYAGANVSLGNSFVLGVDTDIAWSNKQDTKVINKREYEIPEDVVYLQGQEVGEVPLRRPEIPDMEVVLLQKQAENEIPLQREGSNALYKVYDSDRDQPQMQEEAERRTRRSKRAVGEFSPFGRRSSHDGGAETIPGEAEIERPIEVYNHTLRQKWSGATRMRIGFVADRIMPYIAVGVTYAQLQDIFSRSVEVAGKEINSFNLSDETKMMVGYTLGGGIDFAMADNVILRVEYRYSDFGKQKFAKDKLELDYKTNDFRVGVAYKF
ncbi:outer membrane protein [Bartonella schoenbuchensis]|uniref:Hemin binding protein b n=1 Tax=Bartonella schoenbuchensis (strain DSM 13525 / NCTC 13165 / R1) TaxID=687861 RepID=E6Z0U5_BARSR|nr:outer membrane protein [Bartonella schoenbuchensis]AQX31126.1 outer membrane immunogenic protein [Bartonella schoenbuchensis R1]CBI82733.1 Hemin binding protein b [Bartonella schoenbuchensis R1]